jgi:hypothetical protein
LLNQCGSFAIGMWVHFVVSIHVYRSVDRK